MSLKDMLVELDPEVRKRLKTSRVLQSLNEEDKDKMTILAGVVAEVIKQMPDGIPSGHLYATMMDKMALLDYQLILSVIRDAGMISVDNHYITWVPA